MDKHKIVWHRRALSAFNKMSAWYLTYAGASFTRTFAKDIVQTLETLELAPTIGRKIDERGNKTYRAFANHQRCMIHYWHNDKEIHIINLIFTRTDFHLYKNHGL